jgi:CysZ protein
LRTPTQEFISGLTTPYRVVRLLLDHPGLFGLFILPMAITLVTLAILIYALLAGIGAWIQPWIAALAGSYSGILGGFLAALAGLAALWFSFQFLGILIAWISSPFNDRLALQTEKACGIAEPEENLGLLLKSIWLDFKKTILALFAVVLLSIFGLIPGIGILAWVGMAMVNTFVYLSYPLNRRQSGVRDGVLWILSHPARSIGFGIATTLLFSIPVLNLFALPIAVVGGTLNFLRK